MQDFLDSIYKDYRVFAFRGGRVIRGRLRAMTDDRVAEVERQVRRFGWLHKIEDIDGIDYLNCTALENAAPQRLLLHLGLFLAAVVTTLLAGADLGFGRTYRITFEIIRSLGLAGISSVTDVIRTPPDYWLARAGDGFSALLYLMQKGIPFSVAILTILGCHEMGHYVMARRHGMNVTLPFFIPVPLGIGTLGAVITIDWSYSRSSLCWNMSRCRTLVPCEVF